MATNNFFSSSLRAAAAVALLVGVGQASAAPTDLATLFPMLAANPNGIGERVQIGVDPGKIQLTYDSAVTAYFISEGAGYRNTVGWYDAATDPRQASNRNQIWRNASQQGSGGNLITGSSQFLGNFSGGDEFGFYLTADGANRRSNLPTYYLNDALNGDGVSHIVANLLVDQGLLSIGFEDLWGGGDQDYNDVLFVVDIGVANARQIAAGAPEPSEWLLLMAGSVTLMRVMRKRRQNKLKAGGAEGMPAAA
jgi:hypothetical protein